MRPKRSSYDIKKFEVFEAKSILAVLMISNLAWCLRSGLEPTLLAEPDFESGVSTNFTTEAWARIVANLAHPWRAF